MKAIQLLAGATPGDAITQYAFELQSIFQELHFEAPIFAPEKNVSVELIGKSVQPLCDFKSVTKNGDFLLYHYSIGSPATEVYQKTHCRKALCYHNITPAKYFQALYPDRAKSLREGRENLSTLRDLTEFSIADSRYNADEIIQMGFKNVSVVPLIVPLDYMRTVPNPEILSKFRDGKTNFLFVGRMAPNKRFEDLIKTFYYYHKTINPNSRLILVGSYIGLEKYYRYLKCLCFELELEIPAVVCFTGHVVLHHLIAYYHSASAFLCLSEHEGFCVPLIESMHFKVPVFALDRAAVFETLGGAGVLLKTLDPQRIAELLNQVLITPELKENILKKQQERLRSFNREMLKEKIQEICDKFMGNRKLGKHIPLNPPLLRGTKGDVFSQTLSKNFD